MLHSIFILQVSDICDFIHHSLLTHAKDITRIKGNWHESCHLAKCQGPQQGGNQACCRKSSAARSGAGSSRISVVVVGGSRGTVNVSPHSTTTKDCYRTSPMSCQSVNRSGVAVDSKTSKRWVRESRSIHPENNLSDRGTRRLGSAHWPLETEHC